MFYLVPQQFLLVCLSTMQFFDNLSAVMRRIKSTESGMAEEEKWREEVMVFMATISNQMERINNDLYDGTGRAGLVEEFRAYIAEQRGKDAERKMQEKQSDHRWYIVVSLAVIFTALLSLLTYYHMVGR